jgi:hypothetical protein
MGIVELAAKSAALDPSIVLLTVPNSVTPLKKSSVTGNAPCVVASGSASIPKMLRGCEKLKVMEVSVKSKGDRTRGVLLSVAGGEPQAVQVSGTVNFSMRVENVTVRLGSERVSVVSPSGPVIGIRVVELVYALFGSGI